MTWPLKGLGDYAKYLKGILPTREGRCRQMGQPNEHCPGIRDQEQYETNGSLWSSRVCSERLRNQEHPEDEAADKTGSQSGSQTQQLTG